MEIVWRLIKKLKQDCHSIQQPQSWVYVQNMSVCWHLHPYVHCSTDHKDKDPS
jgi:hypothetical protein